MRLHPSKSEKAGVFHILHKTYFVRRFLQCIVSSGLDIGIAYKFIFLLDTEVC